MARASRVYVLHTVPLLGGTIVGLPTSKLVGSLHVMSQGDFTDC